MLCVRIYAWVLGRVSKGDSPIFVSPAKLELLSPPVLIQSSRERNIPGGNTQPERMITRRWRKGEERFRQRTSKERPLRSPAPGSQITDCGVHEDSDPN